MRESKCCEIQCCFNCRNALNNIRLELSRILKFEKKSMFFSAKSTIGLGIVTFGTYPPRERKYCTIQYFSIVKMHETTMNEVHPKYLQFRRRRSQNVSSAKSTICWGIVTSKIYPPRESKQCRELQCFLIVEMHGTTFN